MLSKHEAKASQMSEQSTKPMSLVWLWAAIVGVGMALGILDSLGRLPSGRFALALWATVSIGLFLAAQLFTGHLLSNQMRKLLSKDEMPFQYWTIIVLECVLTIGLTLVALNEFALEHQ